MLHRSSKHLEFRSKYSAARRIFTTLLSVFGYFDETLSLVFDISEQEKIFSITSNNHRLGSAGEGYA